MLMLTVLPFLLATALWGGLLWWGWDPIMGATRSFLEASVLTSWIYGALDWFGLHAMHAVVAPLFVAALAVPLVIASMLLFISCSVPAVVRHLERSYPTWPRSAAGASSAAYCSRSAARWCSRCSCSVTLPLWLVPPFLCADPARSWWGWLTYRVMTYDALADHSVGRGARRSCKPCTRCW
ncbi:EI24 domain-containing protein [Cupriavidus basilensis]